ncbi:condensation domain-containing protein [Streptomyces armeniacus]|nr:condensation domain-containing protein [Streptomyces armeniacus]
MVPAAFVALDALPLTTTGKLDRHALPEPDLDPRSRGRAPRGPVEEVLCGLFGEILGVPEWSIDDDFFAAGGHSLLATKLISRIRSTLGLDVSVRELFEAPTVAGLAKRASAAAGTGARLAPVQDRGERVPLSFAQQRLWFLHQLEGPGATYNIPVALRVTGPLRRPALDQALNDVLARHESLRTVFTEDADGARQVVLGRDAARGTVEWTAVRPDTLDGELERATRYAFDLAAELPLRAWVFSLSESEHVLLLVLHHIAGDGWSLRPLLADLAQAYTARCADRPPEWRPLPVQYADYALWQREALGSAEEPGTALAGQLDHWRQALHGIPEELALPTDRPRPQAASHQGDSVTFDLPEELRAALAGLARETRSSQFMLAQAAVAILLHRLGAGADIPVGAPIAGRTDDALEDLVGLFVNTLVLRTDLSGAPTVRELVARVRETDLAAYENQHVPFERLVEAVNPARSQSRNPLFQVLLAFHNADATGTGGRPEFPGAGEFLEVRTGTARFDLSFAFAEQRHADGTGAGVRGVIEYATELFDRATVETLADRLVRVLEAMTADPDRPVAEVPVLSTAERAELLAAGHGPEADVDGADLLGLFEERVRRAPEATAVVCGGRVLSYAEVDARAGRLAWLLAGRGVGPESLVAPRGSRSRFSRPGCSRARWPSARAIAVRTGRSAPATADRRAPGRGTPGPRCRRRARPSAARAVERTVRCRVRCSAPRGPCGRRRAPPPGGRTGTGPA